MAQYPNWRYKNRKTKYGNIKTLVDTTTCKVLGRQDDVPAFILNRQGVVKADSKKEAYRLVELLVLQRTGQINGLKFQKRFKIYLKESYICSYTADFFYTKENQTVVEDSKGVQTAVFKLKWKLMRAAYPEHEYRIT